MMKKVIKLGNQPDGKLLAAQCAIQNVSNSTLYKCIELFDKLTATEKLIVMGKTCKNCGNTIDNWVCDKCDNPS